MKIYALTDTHFGHALMIHVGRPIGYELKILGALSRTQGDILIHCGDFCIGHDEIWNRDFMDATKGFKTKILVKGNHDRKRDAWYLSRGWDMVVESFTQHYFGKHIVFTHRPVRRYFPINNCIDINIHGHLHGDGHRHDEANAVSYDKEFHKDIAPEIVGYGPVNIQDLISDRI